MAYSMVTGQIQVLKQEEKNTYLFIYQVI